MAAMAEAQTSGIWFDRAKVEEAEYKYQEYIVRGKRVKGDTKKVHIRGGSVAQQIAEARLQIKESLNAPSVSNDGDAGDLGKQVKNLNSENRKLKIIVAKLAERLSDLESRLTVVEKKSGDVSPQPDQPAEKPAPVKDEQEDDDSDIDLFGSDSEDEEEREKLKAERVAAYNERKQKKAAVIAKSSIVLDVKPWDDETDMVELEKLVRSVECDGLRWAASKLVKVAFGIMKLQINCIVEDDKVGTDFLEESITAFEDFVQSVDIVAFNKI